MDKKLEIETKQLKHLLNVAYFNGLSNLEKHRQEEWVKEILEVYQ